MTGLLLIQLGTPDTPTNRGLFPYLRQFLSDRRVIEVPRPVAMACSLASTSKVRPVTNS